MPLLDLTDKELATLKEFYTNMMYPENWNRHGELIDPELNNILTKLNAPLTAEEKELIAVVLANTVLDDEQVDIHEDARKLHAKVVNEWGVQPYL